MQMIATDKIGVFIDGVNFYSTLRELDIQVDYLKLLGFMGRHGNLVRATYYITYSEGEDGKTPIITLLDFLDFNGYTVIAKQSRVFQTKEGEKISRASIAVDLAVDIMEASSWMNHAFLFSGDGDFVPVILALKRKGIKTTIVSSIKTSPSMTSDNLRRKADNFIDLKDVASAIEKEDLSVKGVNFIEKEKK